MSKFSNVEYECLTKDLIGDIFYSDGSFRNKISTIRQYGEVIVRKILDIDPSSQITLGMTSVRNQIKQLPNHVFLENAINTIRCNGNLSTHTQHREEVTQEDFEKMIDSMFDMLAYLHISYFEKYGFGKRQDVLRSFSLLPPIIRFKVLQFLYDKYPDNITIIDKYVLATLKAFDADTAYSWLDNRRDTLRNMKAITDDAANEWRRRFDPQTAEEMLASVPNMYDMCMQKVRDVSNQISNNGHLYLDFESAYPFYLQNGVLDGDDDESVEFNDIMNFLYLGRKENMASFSAHPGPLLIMEMGAISE